MRLENFKISQEFLDFREFEFLNGFRSRGPIFGELMVHFSGKQREEAFPLGV